MGDLHHRILVVEDEPHIRAFICTVLQDEGFKTISASDATEAFEHLTSNASLSLLITDIRIPGYVDGRMFADVAHEYRPGLPILVISGHEKPRSGELPPSARFLSKPFTSDQLLTEIAQLTN